MDATIVNREAVTVLGTLQRIDPMRADYTAIWEQGFMPHHDAIQAQAVEPGYYAVYFCTGRPDQMDMLAGMAVAPATAAVGDLVVRELPAGPYALFTCTMETIGPTWRAIYEDWQQANGQYDIVTTLPCFEYYPPEAAQTNGPVTIGVAVAAR